MGNRLAGRVAIVTGAGRGIGRGEALALVSEGARVVVNDPGVNPDGTGNDGGPADQVVAEIRALGGEAVANYGNVVSMADGEAMVKQALDTFGRLDILVNNAGILRDRMVFNMSEQEWDDVIAVHLKGHFTVTRFAAQVFRQQRSGRIVGTSSTSGLGNMGQANYSAAKEGIVGLIRTLARDLGRYGVTANAIRPTAATRLTLSPEMAEAARRAQAAGVQRGGANAMLAALNPDAIGPLIAYLCTDEAQAINGRTFNVRGRTVGIYSEPQVEKTIWAPGDMWTVDELAEVMPQSLMQGLRNEFAPKEEPAKP